MHISFAIYKNMPVKMASSSTVIRRDRKWKISSDFRRGVNKTDAPCRRGHKEEKRKSLERELRPDSV